MGKIKRDLEGQAKRNLANGKPENHRMPWSLEDLIVVANSVPTVNNRLLLSKALKRSEASIDYVWYDLYRSKKSWRMEFPDGYENNDYIKNIFKARKVVGLTRVFTPMM